MTNTPAQCDAAARCRAAETDSPRCGTPGRRASSSRPAANDQDARARPCSAAAQLRLMSRDSSSTNGSTKWNATSSRADATASRSGPHAVVRDLLRQVRRPDDQELREREVGPQHHEREASACRGRGSGAELMTSSERRPPATASASRTITNANADSPWPPMKSRPQIVENQCGSSDIVQSTTRR